MMVTPSLDHVMILVVFKPLDSYIEIETDAVNKIDRDSLLELIVVEWGGTELEKDTAVNK